MTMRLRGMNRTQRSEGVSGRERSRWCWQRWEVCKSSCAAHELCYSNYCDLSIYSVGLAVRASMTYNRRSDSGRQHLAWLKRQLLAHAAANKSEQIDIAFIGGLVPGDLKEHETHGLRTESLFQELVDALGRFSYIKREDEGDLITRGILARPVDYLVGDCLGRHLAVEVKNCNKATGHFSIRGSDLACLQEYADLVAHELRLAIYWSKWRIWTLVDPVVLVDDPENSRRRRLAFGDACMHNEMVSLGDALILARPPMGVRVRITKINSETRARGAATILARIESLEVFAGDHTITSDQDRRVALHLLFYGTWQSQDWTLHLDEGTDYLTLQATPQEGMSADVSGYASIGYLSTHYTNAVLASLADGATRVGQGVGGFRHGDLGSVIPSGFDFKGSALRLIVIAQTPGHFTNDQLDRLKLHSL
jgi:hypothetical protein